MLHELFSWYAPLFLRALREWSIETQRTRYLLLLAIALEHALFAPGYWPENLCLAPS